MVRILQKYSIPSRFLDIILAFGQKPGNGVAGMAQSEFQQRSELTFGQYSSVETGGKRRSFTDSK